MAIDRGLASRILKELDTSPRRRRTTSKLARELFESYEVVMEVCRELERAGDVVRKDRLFFALTREIMTPENGDRISNDARDLRDLVGTGNVRPAPGLRDDLQSHFRALRASSAHAQVVAAIDDFESELLSLLTDPATTRNDLRGRIGPMPLRDIVWALP